MKKRYGFWTLVGGWILLIIFVGIGWQGFTFKEDVQTKLFAALPAMLIAALLIERTGEIILTLWRGAEGRRQEEELARLRNLLTEAPALAAQANAKNLELEAKRTALPAPRTLEQQAEVDSLEKEAERLKQAADAAKTELDSLLQLDTAGQPTAGADKRERDLVAYKNSTREFAFSCNFTLALLVAVAGFRIVESFVNPPTALVDQARATILQTLKGADDPKASDSKPLSETMLVIVTKDRQQGELTKTKAAELAALTQRLEKKEISAEQFNRDAAPLFRAAKSEVERDQEIKQQLDAEVTKRGDKLLTATQHVTEYGQMGWFRFVDIILTAGLLAGGADPISRIMKLVRDFLDQTNKQVTDTKAR